LLETGSAGEDLWGFNLYPDEEGADFIECDSLINIRSWQGNPGRDVFDPAIRIAVSRKEHPVDLQILKSLRGDGRRAK
jgi:hypothetical protein